MSSKLLPFRLVAVLLAAFLMVTGLQSSASAATKRTATVAASPAVGVVSTAVTFSGKVTRTPKGTLVTIQKKVGKKWVKVKTTRTVNAAGAYAVRLVRAKSISTTAYRAYVAKKGKLSAASSRAVNVAALRRTFASLSATPGATTAGTSVTLGGTVFPFVKGTPISLQTKSGSTWTTIASTTVTANGTFARAVIPTTSTTYRAIVARAGANAPAASNERTVAAKPLITTTSLAAATRFSTYSAQLNTLGNQVGTWTATGLPTGLVLNAATGKITGAPAVDFAGTHQDVNVTIGFTQTSTRLAAKPVTYTLRINQTGKPVILTSTLPNGTKGAAYNQTLTAQGSPVGTWTAEGLPDGLALNPSTGAITGTPTTVGTKQVVVGFTQTGTGQSADPKTITLTIDAPAAPVITTTTLPVGQVGESYHAQLAAQGSPAGTWTAAPLPNGLTLDPSTGTITGTPTAEGDTDVVIGFTQTNTGVAAASKTITLRIGAADAPLITTTALPNATRFAPYSFQVTADAAGTWQATGLPTGLAISASGLITGTTSVAPGDVEVTLTFTRSSPAGQATKKLTLHVDQAPAPVITTSSLPNGDRFQAYSTTLQATGPLANGGTGPVTGTWTATGLPAGLTLNPGTGAITGTPSAAGTSQVQVGFTQANTGQAAVSKTLTLIVNQAPAPVIGTSSLPEGTRFLPYSTTLTAQGNPAGTWTASPLPAGLTLNPSTGAITGTPTAEGDTEVVIGFTQTSTGLAATPKTLTLHVNPAVPPVITTTALPDATRYQPYTATLQVANGAVGTWTASPLPAGMSFNGATGVLSGTPRNAGDTNITFEFTQTNSGAKVSKVLLLHVNQANPIITTADPLPQATPLGAYDIQLQVAPAPVGEWALRAGAPPIGITLKKDGQLSGSAPLPGNSTFTVRFTETSTGRWSEKTFHLKVA